MILDSRKQEVLLCTPYVTRNQHSVVVSDDHLDCYPPTGVSPMLFIREIVYLYPQAMAHVALFHEPHVLIADVRVEHYSVHLILPSILSLVSF